MFDPNIKAKLVFDGKDLILPEEMGTPSVDQLQGTLLERLSEMCCRICYDSCGKGRSSEKMHEHLLDVKHWSVYEHAHFTLKTDLLSAKAAAGTYFSLLNRPGLNACVDYGTDTFRLTLNFRHLLDWHRFTQPGDAVANVLFNRLLDATRVLAPNVLARLKPIESAIGGVFNDPGSTRFIDKYELVEPKFNEEKFVTLFLSGSRGMSHEQVRHRFNMSQRSTRYVDEDKSPYVQHPLISKYLAECEGSIQADGGPFCVRNVTADSLQKDRIAYTYLTGKLQEWLIGKGVDKFTARKQARGAARNYLGNGLLTELMFTANLPSWRDMLGLRCNQAADAEIRTMYGQVLPALKQSQYGSYFEDMSLVPAPDGIGEVLCGT